MKVITKPTSLQPTAAHNPSPITRQQNFRLVQIETNCRQHFNPLSDNKF